MSIILWASPLWAREMGEIPRDFLSRYREILGEGLLQELVKFVFLPLRRALRTNTLKISPTELSSILKERGYELKPVPWCPSGFWVEGEISPGKLVFHMMGLYYIQDASSMAPPELLAPEPGEFVLDMAAAPGGKSTHLAALMEGKGILVVNEPLLYRAKVLVGNLERMGVVNSAVSILRGNTFGWRFPNFFHRVLLDAPCSAEGSTRKDESFFKKYWNLSYIRRAQNVQKSLIVSAIHSLRPGGVLVYSTCTMTPEENEAILTHALEAFPGAVEVEEVKLPGLKTMEGVREFEGQRFHPEVSKIARIWPFLNDTEAFTIFKLKKLRETLPASVRRGRVPEGRVLGREIDRGTRDALVKFFEPYGAGEFFREGRFFLSGDHIWYHSQDFSPLFSRAVFNRVGVKAVRVYSGGKMRPTHALLMAFPHLFRNAALELDEEAALRFASGENLPSPDSALEYVPVYHRGYPIGWGKKNGEVLLNKIPTPLVLR